MRPGPSLLITLAVVSCARGGRAPAAAPPSADPCDAAAFQAGWLIERGKATLSCDDGTAVTLAAGGNISVEGRDGALTLVDGGCRFPLERQGCALIGAAGVACTDDGISYSSRRIAITRDAAGAFSFSYALEHPDPDKPAGKCVAGTEATLSRAAADGTRCPIEGRWRSAVAPDGSARPVSLSMKEGRCTLEGPGLTSFSACQRTGDRITFTDEPTQGKGGCAAGQQGTYALTFRSDCGAVALEADSDACQVRRDVVEFLLMARD